MAAQNHRLPMQRRRLLCLAALGPIATCHAQALEAPDGPVVLTISGRVRSPNHLQQGEPQAQFDMAMLERLPQQSFTTRTPWYSQPRKFTGPLLRDVLSAAMAQGQSLKATALNDYRVEIPVDDVQRYDVLLARLLDDKPMSVRDKGPLFIIYPFETNASLRRALYYTRCAWQLKAIEIS